MKIDVSSLDGKNVGSLELNDAILASTHVRI